MWRHARDNTVENADVTGKSRRATAIDDFALPNN
jgi:hypothetical protein